MTDLKTVQALVEALEDITNCGAEAWGEHRNCNKQARAALTEGRALIAQMQRDAVQPVAWMWEQYGRMNEFCDQSEWFWNFDQAEPDPADDIRNVTPLYAAPHPEAQALDSPRSVTAQEDRVLRNAALRSSTLVASGKLVDSQQQQDDHAGSPAPSEPVGWVPRSTLEWLADPIRSARAYSQVMMTKGRTDECDTAIYTHPATSAQSSKAALSDEDLPDSLFRVAKYGDRGNPVKMENEILAILARAGITHKPLTDEEIKAAAKQAGFLFHTIPEYAPIQHTLPEEFSERCFYRFARAILARAGITRKPLTDEEIMDICKETSMLMWDEVDGYSIRGFARAIEAAHGITPQAGKESGDAS